MTQDAKQAANRANALRSTGPKSQEGKARSAKNAMKHGLLSREVLLSDEDEREFESFARRMSRALSPVGALELTLAERAITATWRLRRLERIEILMFEDGRKSYQGEELGIGSAFVGLSVNGDGFSKLSRYEAGIERTLFRALHELQRMQAARLGREVSVPTAVDVDVNVRSEGPEFASFAS
jgi:hypothetical protein